MKPLHFIAGLTCALGMPLMVAHAEPPRRSPPQEAFDACLDESEGDACNVKIHDRNIEGTCEKFGDRGLACRPNHPPPHGPPPDAPPPDGPPPDVSR